MRSASLRIRLFTVVVLAGASAGMAQHVSTMPFPPGPLSRLFRKAPIPDVDHIIDGIAIADVDGDGRGDLVSNAVNSSTTAGGGLFYFHNDGEEVFSDRSATHVSPPFGNWSPVMVAVDVDGDGDVDFLNGGSLFRNNAGVLVREGMPLVPVAIKAMIAGDVDGDGDADLFLACGRSTTSSNQDQLLLNNGAGLFTVATATHLPADNQEGSGAVFLDADGDGDRDIAVVAAGGNLSLTRNGLLYLNDGLGHFTLAPAAQWPTTSEDCRCVAAADVDGDGDVDLVVGRGTDGFGVMRTDQLWRNDGLGTFTLDPAALPATPDFTNAIAFADVDRDGDRDLILGGGDANLAPRRLRLYRNDGGTFTDATAAWFELPPMVTTAIAVGDFDQDGFPDLALATGSGPLREYPMRTALLHNRGGQRFTNLSPIRLPAAFDPLLLSTPTADVDNDGDVDLLLPFGVGGTGAVRLRMLRNDGLGNLTDVSASQLPPDLFNVKAALFADVDRDGDADLLLAAESTPVVLLENLGGGNFVRASAGRIPFVPGSPTALAWGDLDGDGDGDLAVGYRSSPTTSTQWFRNDGLGNFTHVGGLPGLGTPTIAALALLDVDGDGDLDLVEGLPQGGAAQGYRNNGAGVFTLDTAAMLPAGVRAEQMSAVDLDGDGDLDLIVRPNAGTRLLRNDRTGALVDATPTNLAALFASSAPFVVCDQDGDGRADLMLQRSGIEEMRLAHNDGGFAFSEAATALLPDNLGGVRHIAAADFDGDGDADFFVASAFRPQQLYFGALAQLTSPFVARTDRHYDLVAQADPQVFGPLQWAFFMSNPSLLPVPQQVPGAGLLRVDPTGAIVHGGNSSSAPVAFRMHVQVPNAAILRGLTMYSQALLVHAGGMRLTNMVADTVQ